VPNDYRLINVQALQRSVDHRGGLAHRAWLAARLAVAGQVERDAAHRFPDSLDDRPPRRAIKGEPV
jgi:hypothetical protein